MDGELPVGYTEVWEKLLTPEQAYTFGVSSGDASGGGRSRGKRMRRRRRRSLKSMLVKGYEGCRLNDVATTTDSHPLPSSS